MATIVGNSVRDVEQAEPQQQSVIDNLDPTYREILLTALVAIWFAVSMGFTSGSDDTTSTIGLIAFSAVLSWACYRQIVNNISTLWTPFFWYRLMMMVYFGIGSLVPTWTNDVTRAMMEDFYLFHSGEILKLNLLMAVFHIIFLCTAKALFMAARERQLFESKGTPGKSKRAVAPKRPLISRSNFSMAAFGVICLIVGSTVNLFIVLPQVLGWINLSLFSTLYNLAALSWLGYFMVTLWALDSRKPVIVVLVVMISLCDSTIGIFAMSKAVILLPLVMIGLAFIYHKRTLARIVVIGGLLTSLFMYLSPMITYVRTTNQNYYVGSASPSDVVQMYSAFLGGDRTVDEYSDVEIGWMRLSYVNAGTFAISQYDRGLPGDSYRYWSIVLIPRIIYPNKPQVTDVSREFSYVANGNYDSASSPGLAGEAYWNLGWAGVVGSAIALSLIFTFWSIYSFVVIQRSAWHLFFVVLLGMRTGIRVDGAFVADIMGPAGLAVLAHIVLELFNRFLPNSVVVAIERRLKLA